MSKKTRLNCSARQLPNGKYVGSCKQFPDIQYVSSGYEGALSGARRLAKKRTVTAAVAQAIATPARKLRNRIAIVLDNSGSMQSVRRATVQAFNRVLKEIRDNAAKENQDTYLSLITFDNQVKILRLNEAIAATRDMSEYDYRPDGGTALFDAVGETIERLQACAGSEDEDTSMLVIVITDGGENASNPNRYRDPSKLRALMDRVVKTDRWTIAWQVPRGGKYQLVQQFGMPDGNITEWEEGTERGTFAAAAVTGQSIGAYYTARTNGLRSSSNFYQTDLSKVTSSQVKKALTDVKDECRVLTVEKEQELRDFIESKTKQPLLRGAAFYQLTKSEKKIQDYKKLLVMEKGKGSIYAGDNARQLLGLPSYGTVKVVPGNHANFDVFVQSTSTNRKLVRGSKVVYWANIGVPYQEGPSSRSATARRK